MPMMTREERLAALMSASSKPQQVQALTTDNAPAVTDGAWFKPTEQIALKDALAPLSRASSASHRRVGSPA